MLDDFVSAVMHLRCIGKESLAMKPEQLEAVRQVGMSWKGRISLAANGV